MNNSVSETYNLELRDLTIGYGKSVVARNISACLRGGQLTCLIGRNGIGKSTLLKTVAGLLQPISGEIMVTNVPVPGNASGGEGSTARHADGTTSSHTLSNRDIAIVLTERIDIQGMRVRDIVGLGRSPYTGFFGRLTAEDRRIVDEAMTMVGLPPQHFADRLLGEVSDGERQKAMIAKAIAQQTPVILLDEPTAFLDYPSKRDTMLMLRTLAHEQHKAILISTHDLDVAQRTTDAAWLFSREGLTQLTDTANLIDVV